MEILKACKGEITKKTKGCKTAVLVCEKDGEGLRCDIHCECFNGWKRYRTVDRALYMKGRDPLYESDTAKAKARTRLLTLIEERRQVVFLNKASAKTAGEFFGGDAVEGILEMERNLAKKRQEKKIASENRAREGMERLFSAPAYPESRILARGKEVVPHYAIHKGDGKYLCTACESEVRITGLDHGRITACPCCGATVKSIHPNRMKYKYINDHEWIYVPRIGGGSYYSFRQHINLAELTVTHSLDECARYVEKKKNREYWTKGYEKEWTKGKGNYFVQFSFYQELSSFCERAYVIPDQYVSFLNELSPLTKKIPLDQFFVCNKKYVWYQEQAALKNNLTEESARRIRQLVRNGLPKVADTYSVMSESERQSNFNEDEGRIYKFLRLKKSEFADFKETDGSYDALKAIRNNARRVIVPEIDVTAYREDALKRAKGGNAAFVYHVPVFNDPRVRVLLLRYDVTSRGATIIMSVMDKKGTTYRRVGAHWYRRGYDGYDSCRHMVLNKDFAEFAKNANLGNILAPELMRGMRARLSLLDNPFLFDEKSVTLVEKLSHAGFSKLAREVIDSRIDATRHWYGSDSVIDDMLKRAKERKLYRVLDIPNSIFTCLDRKKLTFAHLDKIRKALSATPGMTGPEVEKYLNLVSSRNLYSFPDLTKNGQRVSETLDYLTERSDIHYHEYEDYISKMKTLGLVISRKRAFPKDFDKSYVDVSTMLKTRNNMRACETMKRLHDALVAQAPLMNFMRRNTNYIVYVPEGPEDLIREGQRLHNCLSTYVDKVAEGNTSVFFIREADKPDQAFVAMEYRNGKIVQIHSALNGTVDPGVRHFADKFVKVLNRIKYEPKQWLNAA